MTNDHDLDPAALKDQARRDLNDQYYYLLLGNVVVLAAWPFIPDVSSFVQSQDLWGVLFIFGSVGGQLALGYMR